MNLHDFFTLMILPIGTSGTDQIQYMKYISEYIPKLQLHQHSLLTRKVFSRHNLSAQVFFSGSSSKLDHYLIKIKVGSSLDHHQSYIITGSSSSLILLSKLNGVISQFYLSQEVRQSHPFFMLVVCLASM